MPTAARCAPARTAPRQTPAAPPPRRTPPATPAETACVQSNSYIMTGCWLTPVTRTACMSIADMTVSRASAQPSCAEDTYQFPCLCFDVTLGLHRLHSTAAVRFFSSFSSGVQTGVQTGMPSHLLRGRVDAPLALQGLHKHRRSFALHNCRPRAVQVVIFSLPSTAHQRQEGRLVLLLHF
jgi:hypothetical protein